VPSFKDHIMILQASHKPKGENRAVAWWHGSKSCSQPILSSSPKGDRFRYRMESSSIKKPSGASAWDGLIFISHKGIVLNHKDQMGHTPCRLHEFLHLLHKSTSTQHGRGTEF
jgi:hypothetical protein